MLVYFQVIMIYGLLHHTPLVDKNYEYPVWANVLGWLMAGMSMACIPVIALVMTIYYKVSHR